MLTSKYVSLWRSLTRSGNYNKEEAYEEILKRIKEDQELAKQGTLKVDDGKEIGDVDPENLIPKKPKGDGNKKPVIKIIKRDDSKIAAILKEQITGDLGNKFKKLDTSGKAKFRQQFIKQLVEIGGMNRQEAIDLVKKYYP